MNLILNRIFYAEIFFSTCRCVFTVLMNHINDIDCQFYHFKEMDRSLHEGADLTCFFDHPDHKIIYLLQLKKLLQVG